MTKTNQGTLEIYDEKAEEIAAGHRGQVPVRMYALVETFFTRGKPTADIGCGSGRDTDHLQRQGYPATGFDASEGMLREAAKSFPGLEFRKASLPGLAEIPDGQFTNVLCSAVLMHLASDQLIEAAIHLLRITATNGRILLSFCPPRQDADPRLFSAIDPARLKNLFESLGGKILWSERNQDSSRPDIVWEILAIEKTDGEKTDGIFSAQKIITQDAKDTTYKYALLRSLCYIAQHEPSLASWQNDKVAVPIERIALCWLKYYWVFIKKNIKQSKTHQSLAFQKIVNELPYKEADLHLLLDDYDEGKKEKKKPIDQALNKITQTIIVGPVKHAGHINTPIFAYNAKNKTVEMSASIWQDLIHFNHWIEDSLLIGWARLTEKINQNESFASYLKLLSREIFDERDTNVIRKLFKNQKVECVWSGKEVTKYDVDHVIPYSVWKNNDLWNLMPASCAMNNEKRARIPSLQRLQTRKEPIVEFWRLYKKTFPERFGGQLERAFGVRDSANFENQAHAGLVETCERLGRLRGVGRW